MYKHLASVILGGAGLVALGSLPTTDASVLKHDRVNAGKVVFHFVGHFDRFSLPGPELVGFLTHIDGFSGSLFNGPPGVGTAHFTLRIKTFGPPPFFPVGFPMGIGDTRIVVSPAGAVAEFFFDPSPDPTRTFSDSAKFSTGTPIATLRNGASLAAQVQTVGVGGGPQLITVNKFSADLISSKSIRFNGKKLDFKKLVPDGVTIQNFSGSSKVFGASAVAIGEDDG